MIPRPRERRQTALRWLGPKLCSNVGSKGSVEKGSGKHEHPVEHQRHKRGDHETHVDHSVGREGEPTVLSVLGDLVAFRLLRSRDGSTRIFSSNTNSKQEPMIQHRRSSKRQPSREKT